MFYLSQFVHEMFQGYIVFWSSLKNILQNSFMCYFKTRFFRLLIKVEMADQSETFDLNDHMHDASNSIDVHLKFGNLLKDSRT